MSTAELEEERKRLKAIQRGEVVAAKGTGFMKDARKEVESRLQKEMETKDEAPRAERTSGKKKKKKHSKKDGKKRKPSTTTPIVEPQAQEDELAGKGSDPEPLDEPPPSPTQGESHSTTPPPPVRSPSPTTPILLSSGEESPQPSPHTPSSPSDQRYIPSPTFRRFIPSPSPSARRPIPDDNARDESLYLLISLIPMVKTLYEGDYSFLTWGFTQCTNIIAASRIMAWYLTIPHVSLISTHCLPSTPFVDHHLYHHRFTFIPFAHTLHQVFTQRPHTPVSSPVVESAPLDDSSPSSPSSPPSSHPHPLPSSTSSSSHSESPPPPPTSRSLLPAPIPTSTPTQPSTSRQPPSSSQSVFAGESMELEVLHSIHDRVQTIPSSIQLQRLLDSVVNDHHDHIAETQKGLIAGLEHIAQAAAKVPKEMSLEFQEDLRKNQQKLLINLQSRDEYYMEKIMDQRKSFMDYLQLNDQSMTALRDKVFELSQAFNEFKATVATGFERFDGLQAQVMNHHQLTQRHHSELRGDIQQNSAQLNELVQSVQTLSDRFPAQSTPDDDKKGETSTQRRPSQGRRDDSRSREGPSGRRGESTQRRPPAPTFQERPPPPPPAGQSSRFAPGSSSSRAQEEVTPTGLRLPLNDPDFVNRSLRGIRPVNVQEEEDIPDVPGPRPSSEELIRRATEGRQEYERRREAERRDPPKPKRHYSRRK